MAWYNFWRREYNTPAGTVIYAIGDIHGRADLLKKLREEIRRDASRHAGLAPMIVYLGDYVDRGLESSAVLDMLLTGTDGFHEIHLLGNHEQMLLDFLRDARIGQAWVEANNGGGETLLSYGIEPPRNFTELPEVQKKFKAALPEEHLQFLQELKPSYEAGDYFFAHAGVHPNRPLSMQRTEDLIWIREPFLSSQVNYGKKIVHGHTIVAHPESRANRINVDTGAYWSGVLTAVALSAEKPYFLHT